MTRLQDATTEQRPVRLAQLQEATAHLEQSVVDLDCWLRQAWDKVDAYDAWLKAHPDVDDYAERVAKTIALEERLVAGIVRYTRMHQTFGRAVRVLEADVPHEGAASQSVLL